MPPELAIPAAIAPTEMAAWFALHGVRPSTRLLWYVRALDAAWRRAMREGVQIAET
jgi:hypothetical protein